jgi:hypothetical protein
MARILHIGPRRAFLDSPLAPPRAASSPFSASTDGRAGRSLKNEAGSPTDRAARYTAAADTPAAYACSDNYLVDLKNAVIMDVEATTTVRQADRRGHLRDPLRVMSPLR